MGKVDAGDAFLLPDLAEGGFIVEKTQFLDYVVHDQVGVDRWWLALKNLSVRFAKFIHLRYVESLIRVETQHGLDHLPELG